jgi:hypothetical protein
MQFSYFALLADLIAIVHFIAVMSRRQTRSQTAVAKRSSPKRAVEKDERVSAVKTQTIEDDTEDDIEHVPPKKPKRNGCDAKREPVKKRTAKRKPESEEDDWEEVALSRWCATLRCSGLCSLRILYIIFVLFTLYWYTFAASMCQ